jgi:endonuclease/exonuclease/phosphatase family metal-dependent hydrolase
MVNSFDINTEVACASVKDSKGFLVYSANIHKDNRWLSRLVGEISNRRPDVVFLVEVRPRHINELTAIFENYKYIIIDPKMYKTGIGLVFLSTYPVKTYNLMTISDSGNGIIRAILDVKGREIVFYGVHLPRIGINRSFKVRQQIFIRLASIIADESMPVIVTGDFNTTSYSPIFKKFSKISKLESSNHGWHPTWPSFFPPLWIPIDHVLVKQGIHIVSKERGTFIFSDHFPIMATLSL